MRVRTLAKVMSINGHHVTFNRLENKIYFDRELGGPSFPLRRWMYALNAALRHAHCKTPDRVAMFLAQIGEESGSFRYTEEIASGAEYEWRSDLGNNQPGDGVRYKGRTYLQITGRHNYAGLSAWAHDKGYVPTSTFFVDHPEKLAHARYIFLGPIWYWTVARHMNGYADAGDIYGATQAVNGGYNGLQDRTERWNYARTFGDKLLPTRKPISEPVPTLPPVEHHGKHRKPDRKPRPAPTKNDSVVVQYGDTLGSIASRHGTTWQKLQRLNHISNPNLIYVGQVLRVR